ncbi:MAG TPA: hypothetical protein VGE74_27165 [Gemmata sp.]
MAEPTLEQRVEKLEQELAALRSKVEAPVATGAGWVERLGGTFKNDEAFQQMVEYGRYFRKTGHEAPPDWEPGDPIPEPDEGGAT